MKNRRKPPQKRTFLSADPLKIGNGPNTVSGSTVSNTELSEFRPDGKGGSSLREVAFVTVFGSFDGFGGSGKHLALSLLVLQNTVPRGSHDGFDGLAVVAVPVMTATPLKLNPLFRHPESFGAH